MVCFDTDFLVALLRKDEEAIEKLETYVEKADVLSTTVIYQHVNYLRVHIKEKE